MERVSSVWRESVVDEPVSWFGEWADACDDVEDFDGIVVVLGSDERVDIGEVGLGVLLDQWRVAVAGRLSW